MKNSSEHKAWKLWAYLPITSLEENPTEDEMMYLGIFDSKEKKVEAMEKFLAFLETEDFSEDSVNIFRSKEIVMNKYEHYVPTKEQIEKYNRNKKAWQIKDKTQRFDL